jgi:hypothetical protein
MRSCVTRRAGAVKQLKRVPATLAAGLSPKPGSSSLAEAAQLLALRPAARGGKEGGVKRRAGARAPRQPPLRPLRARTHYASVCHWYMAYELPYVHLSCASEPMQSEPPVLTHCGSGAFGGLGGGGLGGRGGGKGGGGRGAFAVAGACGAGGSLACGGGVPSARGIGGHARHMPAPVLLPLGLPNRPSELGVPHTHGQPGLPGEHLTPW